MKQFRIKLDKRCQHFPQFKWGPFWLCFRDHKRRVVSFRSRYCCDRYLEDKHNYELFKLDAKKNAGIIKWEPTCK